MLRLLQSGKLFSPSQNSNRNSKKVVVDRSVAGVGWLLVRKTECFLAPLILLIYRAIYLALFLEE